MVTGGKISIKDTKKEKKIPGFICGMFGVWGVLKVKSKYLSKYYI